MYSLPKNKNRISRIPRIQRLIQAEDLFYQGQRQLDLSNFNNAAKSFQEAYDLYHEIHNLFGESASLNNLGLISYHQGLLEQAINYFQESLMIERKVNYKFGIALSLGNIGRSLFALSQYDEASNYLRRAWKLLRGIKFRKAKDSIRRQELRRMRANVQGNLGDVFLLKGKYSEAIKRYKIWLREARKLSDLQLKGSAFGGLGNAYQNLGNHKRAIDYHQKHLSIAREIKDQLGESKALNNLANSYRVIGKRQEAIDYLNQSLEIKRKIGNFLDEGSSVGNLGILYLSVGRSKEAIDCFIESLDLARATCSLHQESLALSNLGNAYFHRNQYQEAITCFEQHLKISQELGEKLEEAGAIKSLGAVYASQGEYSKAVSYFIDALDQQRKIGNSKGEADALSSLSAIYFNQKQYAQALSHCRQALRLNREIGDFPDEVSSLCLLGTIYSNLNDNFKAIKLFQSAVKICIPAAMPFESLKAAKYLGDAMLKTGDLDSAIAAYNFAIEAIEKCRLQAKVELDRQSILRQAIDVYSNMVKVYIEKKKFDQAIETIERSRSKWLSDFMERNHHNINSQIPQEIQVCLQKYEIIQRNINELCFNSKDNSNLIGTNRNRASLGAIDVKVQELEVQKQIVREELNGLDSVSANLLEVDAMDFKAIQSLVDNPSTALLTCYSTISDTHILIVRQNGVIDCHTCFGQGSNSLQDWLNSDWLLPYTKINEIIDNEEREQARNIWKKGMPNILKELAKRLQIEDLIDKLNGIKELILIPHLGLHQIPFSAIPTKHGFLGDHFQFRHIPSCQILKLCQKRPPIEVEEFKLLRHGFVENATEDLPCSNFEGEKISGLLKIPNEQRLRGRNEATVKNYRQLIQKMNVIISSHHAQSRLDNPLESGLILSDGAITLGEMLTPGWRFPNLSDVFLSCCETGFGLPNPTDDILTLATGFLCAGARNVVSTLWSVDDMASALFSILYHQFRQTCDRSTALQKAQQDLRQMSGTDLSLHYKQHLLELLDQKFDSAEIKRQQAEQQMRQYDPDVKDYQNWKLEHDFWAKVSTRVEDTQTRLKELCRKSFPFSHPIYWAGFISQGLR